MKLPENELWLEACREKISKLGELSTLIKIRKDDIPLDADIYRSLWTFKIKPERYEARYRLDGSKDKGKAYEVFTHTLPTHLIRLFLYLKAKMGLHMVIFDVSNAFPTVPLVRDEKVIIIPPAGLEDPDIRYELLTNLHGLSTAGRAYQLTVCEFLEKLGMERIQPCIYRSKTIFVIFHINDFMVLSLKSKQDALDWTTVFAKKWAIRIEENPTKFVGIEFELSDRTVRLHQESYIDDVLTKYKMKEAKSMTVPMIPYAEMDDGKYTMTDWNLKAVVGSLLYLSNGTRPDIAFAVGHLARFAARPTDTKIVKAKHLLRYLKGHQEYGLFAKITKIGKHVRVRVYVDASWASNSESMRSVSGFIIFIDELSYVWRSKIQTVVALSTAESELYAISLASVETIHLMRLLDNLGLEYDTPVIYSDSQSAIDIIKNEQIRTRLRHVDMRKFFVREQIAEGKLILQHLPGVDNTSDGFTKPLQKNLFLKHDAKIIGTATGAFPMGGPI
jgi:hypothetical protein